MMRNGVLTSGYGPWRVRDKFEVQLNRDDGPIWTFDRMGRTETELPDGRVVCVGGEHEDFYDPDFCIYNDVVIYHGDGTFDAARVYPVGWAAPKFVLSDLNNDGALDLAIGGHVYLNLNGWNRTLHPNGIPAINILPPGRTPSANLYAQADILDQPIIPVPYYLSSPDGASVGRVQASYSIDGGGKWLPAVPANITATTHLSTTLSANVPFGWIDIAGATSTNVSFGLDDSSGPFPLGFPIKTNGREVSEFTIGKAGWIAFDVGGNSYGADNLCQNNLGSASLIAPFWDDLDPNLGGSVYFKHTDADTLVITYDQVPRSDGTGSYTFQVILRRDGTHRFVSFFGIGDEISKTRRGRKLRMRTEKSVEFVRRVVVAQLADEHEFIPCIRYRKSKRFIEFGRFFLEKKRIDADSFRILSVDSLNFPGNISARTIPDIDEHDIRIGNVGGRKSRKNHIRQVKILQILHDRIQKIEPERDERKQS